MKRWIFQKLITGIGLFLFLVSPSIGHSAEPKQGEQTKAETLANIGNVIIEHWIKEGKASKELIGAIEYPWTEEFAKKHILKSFSLLGWREIEITETESLQWSVYYIRYRRDYPRGSIYNNAGFKNERVVTYFDPFLHQLISSVMSKYGITISPTLILTEIPPRR